MHEPVPIAAATTLRQGHWAKKMRTSEDMRQVYKGEIEEKLSSGLEPLDEDHYLPQTNIKQVFFAVNLKNTQKNSQIIRY